MRQTFFLAEFNPSELHQALIAWFSTSRGRRLLELELECMKGLVDGLYGLHGVQIGIPARLKCPGIRHQVRLGGLGQDEVNLVGDSTAIPLQSDSVDLVVLGHALDFSSDPHQVLREVDRILIPEGRLILVGFNPFSIWGFGRLLHLRGEQIPWSASFISRVRVEDWLRLLGFALERREYLSFAPPEQFRGLFQGHARLKALSRSLWSPFSAVYVIYAVKRVIPPTLVRPSWKLRPILIDSRMRGGQVGRGTVSGLAARGMDGKT